MSEPPTACLDAACCCWRRHMTITNFFVLQHSIGALNWRASAELGSLFEVSVFLVDGIPEASYHAIILSIPTINPYTRGSVQLLLLRLLPIVPASNRQAIPVRRVAGTLSLKIVVMSESSHRW